MTPWFVLASHDGDIGPASCVGALQVVPPSLEETKPTSSWQLELQFETG
jgi:hypothetical protein